MKRIGIYLWKFFYTVLDFIVFRIFRLKLSEEAWKNFIQFVKFSIIGFSNTIVSYVFYVIFLFIFQKKKIFLDIDYLVAQLISFLVSVLWSFYWNRKYVFCETIEETSWGKALLKTYASYAFTGIFLNSVISVCWVQYFHISKIVVPVINLLLSVPTNFILNKFWAFKGI